jgi:type II secretory pathway component GspD/PulD (secretin)
MDRPIRFIAKKTISTVFALDSGKTVAIGGLTETSDREVTSKIPLPGDIPLLGKYLFSHTHKEKSQEETIIFVTVGLAMPDSILRETGLPEDTELARRHLIASETKRRALLAEIDRLSEASHCS